MLFEVAKGKGDFRIEFRCITNLLFDVVRVINERGGGIEKVFRVEDNLIEVVIGVGFGMCGETGEGVSLHVGRARFVCKMEIKATEVEGPVGLSVGEVLVISDNGERVGESF